MSDITQLKVCTLPDNHVAVLCNGLGAALPWAAGVELYQAVKRLAKFSEAYAAHKDHSQVKSDHETVAKITVHRTGLAFLFELDNRKWFECPWEAAMQMADAVYQKSREVEEIEKSTQLIADAAILLRTGLPIGLTNNKQIQKEAWKAAEDVDFPGSVEPTAIIGAPTIIQHPPKLAIVG